MLPRLNHRLGWRSSELADLADILSIEAELVEPAAPPQGKLRDAKDLPVLRTLLTSGADYLITGGYPILTPAQFWSRHGG